MLLLESGDYFLLESGGYLLLDEIETTVTEGVTIRSLYDRYRIRGRV